MESGLGRDQAATADVGPAAAASTAAEESGPALAQAPAKGVAQRLYADALQSVLSFLPLHDTASAAAACRQWLNHAAKSSPRGLSLDIHKNSRLLAPPAASSTPRISSLAECSALCQHFAVCRVRILGGEDESRVLQPRVVPLLSVLSRFTQLERLLLQLPQISPTAGNGSAQLPLVHDLSPLLPLPQLHTLELGGVLFTAPQSLPPSLRHLKVFASSTVPLHAQHLADAIGQLPLLEWLVLLQPKLLRPYNAQGAEHECPRWKSWLQLARLHTVQLN